MKNNSNMYDIDGELIRNIDDTHHFTIEEIKQKIDKYRQKLEELSSLESPTKDQISKITAYKTYIRNLNNAYLQLISNMSKDEFTRYITENMQQGDTEEQVKSALKDLENDINDGAAEVRTTDEVQGTIPGDNGYTTNEEPGDDETIEREQSDIHEERPTTQSDLLVERTDVTNNMDEYVSPIGEASDEYVDYIEEV